MSTSSPGHAAQGDRRLLHLVDRTPSDRSRALRAGQLLLDILALLNESNDVDDTLRQILGCLTTPLDACVVEIWLTRDATDGLALCQSSTDASPSAMAFADAGRRLPAGALPIGVARVVRTGRMWSAAKVGSGPAERSHEARALGITNAAAYPIQIGVDGIGVIVVYRKVQLPVDAETLDAVRQACHHIGRFLEKSGAEFAIEERARELSALASTDALTGLKNRREFDRALRTIPREPFAVLSMDVDCLKDVNDTHGHPAGDALLRLIGSTLGLVVRGWDVMARVGGDEFAAMLPGVGVFGAALVGERMRAAVRTLELPTGPVRISVGWSAGPSGADPVSVWARADENLYQAKRSGRDQVVGFSYEGGELGDIAARSYSDVVVRILEGGAMTTMFQPIVQLSDGLVMGYEALARPEGFAAMDSVEDVFEAARTGGQIRDLDGICRRQAIIDAAQLPGGAPLFLNMSAAALLDPVHGVDQLLAQLETVKRVPASVVLEITEHERIRDYAALARILSLYRAEGFRFAVDDVGEGHSTLELLAASSSEYLKLGRSLTMTSTRLGSRAAIRATTAFAETTGAVVIAEGVENEFVAGLMQEAGIVLGQGFGLGKPTLAGEVEDVRAALTGRAALSALRPRSEKRRRPPVDSSAGDRV